MRDPYLGISLLTSAAIRTSNMFVPYRVSIKDFLDSSDESSEHELQIVFNPTFAKGRQLQRENADKTPAAFRGVGATGGAGSYHCLET